LVILQSCFERIVDLNNNIESEEFREIGRLSDNSFTRDRALTFSDINWIILSKKGISTAMELYNYYKTKKTESVSVQAFSKARMNLDPKIFVELNKRYLEEFYGNVPFVLYKGYVMLAVDGCVMDLWNEQVLKEEFGGIKDKNGEISLVKGQTCGIYDCLNDMIVDFQLAPYNTSEKELGIKNIKNAMNFFKDQKLFTVFDRYFPSIELFHFLNKNKIKFICRIKKVSYKEEKELMTSNDECVDIKITKNRMNHIKDKKTKEKLLEMEKIRLRITKVILENREEEHLISNWYFDEVDYNEMKELYAQRWEIEKSFNVLKNKLEIENISGQSKIAIEQDFNAQILVHNIIQDVKNEAERTKRLKKT
jgi:hypothetical protein